MERQIQNVKNLLWHCFAPFLFFSDVSAAFVLPVDHCFFAPSSCFLLLFRHIPLELSGYFSLVTFWYNSPLFPFSVVALEGVALLLLLLSSHWKAVNIVGKERQGLYSGKQELREEASKEWQKDSKDQKIDQTKKKKRKKIRRLLSEKHSLAHVCSKMMLSSRPLILLARRQAAAMYGWLHWFLLWEKIVFVWSRWSHP